MALRVGVGLGRSRWSRTPASGCAPWSARSCWAACDDRGAPRAGAGRAAGHGGEGQVGVADGAGRSPSGRPERVGRDLGQHGAGAGADVDGADRDGVAAVVERDDPGGVAGHAQRRVRRRRDAGAHPPVAVAGGARPRRVASAQPNRSAPRSQALDQTAVVPGLAGLGVDGGLVAHPQRRPGRRRRRRPARPSPPRGRTCPASRRAPASTTGRRRRARRPGGSCGGAARRTSSGRRSAVCSANSLIGRGLADRVVLDADEPAVGLGAEADVRDGLRCGSRSARTSAAGSRPA